MLERIRISLTRLSGKLPDHGIDAQLRSYSNQASTPPPSYFRNGTEPPRTYDQLQAAQFPNPPGGPKSSPQYDNESPVQKYKEISKGVAYLSIAGALIYILLDLKDQLDKAKKQVTFSRKNQKEMLIQMQSYKKKVAQSAIKNTQKHTIIEGKMQMHIALLRQQLIDSGLDPVSIDEALDEFDERVRMATTGNSVTLWVPGESKLKSLIPDPNEYSKKV
ncbi:DEKNAAC101095 [Brettanomyces naardenensis]|uniref:DEKNAAC101095 n=1 Tax=Brettanomyces naardenensis TaxID=13370 RepID=A0A448YH86_BRENA|nr:DEKNAAC101095 [Brettanomyces naardenensis]